MLAPDVRRYSRHLLIPEVGLAGQRRIAAARILVVGAGGLGCPALQYLAAAGVGRLGIVDDDAVELSNLQRQVLYATADVGRPKALAAAERLAALNPDVALDPYPVRFTAANARTLVRPYDVIVDATDSFAARYAINDAARLEGKPEVYGSIFRFDGQLGVFAPGGACYRCLFPEPPPAGTVPTCAEGGVLGVLAGLVGTWQAAEALKLILGIGDPLAGRLLVLDVLGARTREFAVTTDPACPLHGERPTIVDVVAVAPDDGVADAAVAELAAEDLDAYLAAHPATAVLDVREPRERPFAAPRAIEIPASELDARLAELDTARELVVACGHGAVSRWAIARLRAAGFGRLRHLEGGLSAREAARERERELA